MHFYPHLLSLLLATMATGCSTIAHIGHPSILEVKSLPPGVDIFVDGVRRGTSPAQVTVEGDSGPHFVRLEKKGYVTQEFMVDKSMSNWVWGNAPFVVFPLVAAAGVGIDAALGKWYRFEPDEIAATLSAIPPSLSDSVPVAVVGDIDTPVVVNEISASSTNSVDKISDDMDSLLRGVLENN